MKKILSLLFISLSLVSSSQVPTNGLYAYYPFCGNGNDYSGNNRHLTVYGNPVFISDQWGNSFSACNFSGAEYLRGSATGVLGKSSRSVTFWARTNVAANNAGYCVLNYGEQGITPGSRFEVGLNSMCNGLYNDWGFVHRNEPFNTTDNKWHFYAIVYDSTVSNNVMSVKFFADGNLLSNNCYLYGPTQAINTFYTDTASALTIGFLSVSYPRNFKGSMDEVRLYSRALSNSEVQAIYTSSACVCVPSAPSAIKGPIIHCIGASKVYSISPVAGATNYSWTLPSGCTGSSNTNTILLTVSPSANIFPVLQVKASNNCGESAAVSYTINTAICEGISEQEGALVTGLYPNPSSGLTEVAAATDCLLELTNTLGMTVMTCKMHAGSNTIDVKQLPAGVYFAGFSNGNTRTVLRLIRE